MSLMPISSHETALDERAEFFLPSIILRSGERTTRAFLEFFAARIRNENTREAYLRAVRKFLDWCDAKGLEVETIQPVAIALYIEELGRQIAAPSVKQHLAAIRMLFDFFVLSQVLPYNPSSSVRGPRMSYQEGKTPVLYEDEANLLFSSIDTSSLKGVRDRAILGVMVYTFARVGALCRMKVGDFEVRGLSAYFRLSEKGGKFNRVPAHHKAIEFVERYLWEAGIDKHEEREEALFRRFRGRSKALSGEAITRKGVWKMIRERAKDAGMEGISPHSLRATGITDYLANGGDVTIAQRMAGHADIRTTRIYDRNPGRVQRGEIERIRVAVDI